MIFLCKRQAGRRNKKMKRNSTTFYVDYKVDLLNIKDGVVRWIGRMEWI